MYLRNFKPPETAKVVENFKMQTCKCKSESECNLQVQWIDPYAGPKSKKQGQKTLCQQIVGSHSRMSPDLL